MLKAMQQASAPRVLEAMPRKQCRQDKTRQHNTRHLFALSSYLTLGNEAASRVKSSGRQGRNDA